MAESAPRAGIKYAAFNRVKEKEDLNNVILYTLLNLKEVIKK